MSNLCSKNQLSLLPSLWKETARCREKSAEKVLGHLLSQKFKFLNSQILLCFGSDAS